MNGVLSSCLSLFKGVASGTLFSCQRHFIFFLSLTIFFLATKAEIATWDCWCLSEEGCCSRALEQHQGFGQSKHKNLIVFFGNRFLSKASPQQVHASWYMHQHISPAPFLHCLLPHSSTDSYLTTLFASSCTGILPHAASCSWNTFSQTGPVTFGSLVCIQAFLENLLFSSQRTN